MDAPITARVCEALADALSRDSETGWRTLDWPGDPIHDALPLRLVGGLHALARTGIDADLTALFAGTGDAPAILRRVLVDHDAALLP
ncbi:DUF2332 family protein, partial [Salmonella enterica subsp. enterica]